MDNLNYLIERMFQWRRKVTNNRLLRWYTYIGVAMILLFATSAVGCSTTPPTVQDILKQEPAGYPKEQKCNSDTTFQYCKGPSPTQMECYCIAINEQERKANDNS